MGLEYFFEHPERPRITFAKIDDVSLGTNTQEDHILLIQKIFTVCRL